MTHTDVLVVGQGLAGSALAWRLIEAGREVVVVDRGNAGKLSASQLAVGLITPITGKRLTLDPQWLSMRLAAEKFYRRVERVTAATLFESRPAYRLFTSAAEQAEYAKRRQDAAYAEQTAPLPRGDLPASICCDRGGLAMPTAARLNVAAFLDATRDWLKRRDAYRQATIASPQELQIEPQGVTWPQQELRAGSVVFCEGFTRESAARLPNLRPAKGELLRVRVPGLGLTRVLHRDLWIAPLLTGEQDEYWIGASYDWNPADDQPTDAARQQLTGKLRVVCDLPVEILDHQAAIRPATVDRQPMVELSAEQPRIASLNGLGSRGAIYGPWYAQHLVKQLFTVRPD